jgi:predicted nucleic acid-binding Zn ribbon protein
MPEGKVTERQATVRLLPARQSDPDALRRACKRPRCGNEIDPPAGRSRPREFCSDSCRNLYQREREQARNNLLEARRLAAQYEIDDTAAAEGPPRQREPAEPPQDPGGLPLAAASYLALALVAQALESIRVDMQGGKPAGPDEVLARITQAKEEGDRLLRTFGQQPPAR